MVAALVAALMLIFASTASAELIGVYGPIKGDTGKKGEFHADVHTNSKGVVTRVSFVQLQWLDFQCTDPAGKPFALDLFEYDFPGAKVRKMADRYVFSTSNGSFDGLSATVRKDGKRIHGTIRVHQEYIDGPEAGSTCDAQTTFNANKSV